VDALNQEVPIYRAAEKIRTRLERLSVVRPIRVQKEKSRHSDLQLMGGNLPAIGRQTTVQDFDRQQIFVPSLRNNWTYD